MKIDKAQFSIHTIDLNNAKVLIRPDQAEGAKGKNVIIGDDRPLNVDNKILAREVIQEKTPDGKKNLRIILKPRTLRGQEDSSSGDRSSAQQRPVKPVAPTGQNSSDQERLEILKSECPKMNGGKDHNNHNGKKPKLSFDELLLNI